MHLTFYHITHRCTAALLNVAANASVNSQPGNKYYIDIYIDIAKGFLCQRITAANKNTEDGKQTPDDTCEKFLPQTLH